MLHLTQVNDLTLSTVVRTHKMPEAEACEWKPRVYSSAFNCKPLAVLFIAFSNCSLGLWRDHRINFLFDFLEYRFPEVKGNCDYSLQIFTSHFPSVIHENFTVAPYILSLIPYSHLSPKAKQNQWTPPPK